MGIGVRRTLPFHTSIRQPELEASFYPDYIGSIGIYDPKDGITRSAQETFAKSNALRHTSARTPTYDCAAASCGRRRAAGSSTQSLPTISQKMNGKDFWFDRLALRINQSPTSYHHTSGNTNTNHHGNN